VVLVGERRTEERHDAVAHHLVNGAFRPVDGPHHQLQDGIEDLACVLGITVGQQLHRVLHVGKENCDLLALAFQSSLRREDTLGEVPGSVGLGGGKAWLGSRRVSQGLGAL
jgi:hypothetical protein